MPPKRRSRRLSEEEDSTNTGNISMSQEMLTSVLSTLQQSQAEFCQQLMREMRASTPSQTDHAAAAAAAAASVSAHTGNYSQCTARYSGQESLEAFIDAIESYKSCLRITEENALRGMSMLLTGAAGVWWQGVKDSIGTWSKAIAKLRSAFGERRPPFRIYQDLFVLVQGNENTELFIAKVRALLAKLPRDDLSERVQIDMTFGLLDRRIRKRLDREAVTNFDQLLEKCQSIEDSLKEDSCRVVMTSSAPSKTTRAPNDLASRAYVSTGAQSGASAPVVSSAAGSRVELHASTAPACSSEQRKLSTKRLFCVYCKRSGHTRDNCDKSKVRKSDENVPLKCYGCGAPNVIKSKCKNCTSGQDFNSVNVGAFDAAVPVDTRAGSPSQSHDTPQPAQQAQALAGARARATPGRARKVARRSPPPAPSARGEAAARESPPSQSAARGDFAQRNPSPPAHGCKDCLHLQLYRDPKDRFKKGQTKASLSLQQFLGFESGFTLDKESNTIAIICQDVIVVLAFETRERLIAWQVKVGSQLGSSKEWLVMVGGGSRKLPAGPARLHLQGRRFTLTSGVPPRLLGLWELAHLRRYGVVEGRFCFEGGSHCGKGEGLHVLITDQAQDITDGFDAAAHGNPKPPASRKSGGADRNRPDTRLSDLNGGEQSLPDTGLYEQNFFGEDCGEISPFWPSDERRGFDEHDCKGCEDSATRPPWSGADHVTLERCSNCVTKLGTMTRSSTVALTPGTHFNPAWTMEAVPESNSDKSSNSTEYLTPRAIKKSLEVSQCSDWAPQRPPKPARLDEKKPPAALPVQTCSCANDKNLVGNANNPKVGPYENYDVPKPTHVEVEVSNEYYDTPKRIKQALAEDLFQVTKSSAPGNLVLKKNCGCILKFASKKKPVVVECDENIQPVDCPCQKVTNWANNLISLPYCKRNMNYDKVNTEVLSSQKTEEMALYATVDVTRKTNRQSSITEKDSIHDCNEPTFMNYENLEPKSDNFEDPYANYENLEFALSLEYYENAKDLLKKAGVTQKELDALSANVDFAESVLPTKPKCCAKCGHHSAKSQAVKKNKSDEYLLMEPSKEIKRDLCRTIGPNPGYTPMSPNPNWSQSLRHPLQKTHKVDIEKSLSIPALNGGAIRMQSFDICSSTNNNKESTQKRSSSVDSARLLEDLKEFDSSIGIHATSSSLETLRNLAIENRRSSSPCDNGRDCCDQDCCKSSDSENKTSEGSCSKDVPHLRNKHMDNAQIKRSSSVPCKSGGNRDSSSSNDSGVSSCSMKHGPEFNEFEMPLTSGHSRHQYMAHRRIRGNATGCIHSSLPRKSKSSDLRDMSMQIHRTNVPAKSSSAEAEVPVLPPKQFKGVMDTHSTSSGTSDMSDYIETLSLTSSHSSSDNANIRMARQPTMTLRPRSGKEYQNLDPIITSMYKSGKELSNYTNIP